MKAELAPPRGGAAPGRMAPRALAAAAVLSLLAATLFYSILLFGGALHHYDWQSHHFHYFDWVRISLTRFHTLPLYMSDAWVTRDFLANAEAPSLGPLVGLLGVLPTGAYIKLLIVVFAASGLFGMFALLRDLEVSAPVAVFAAAVFAFNGFFVSHLAVGHHWAMGGYLMPGLLCLFRRAALGSGAALWGAAALDAFTILGGQHQPFVWQNLLLGGFALLWSLRVRAVFPLARLALLWLAAAGLAAVKLLPMLAEFAGYDPAARIPGLPPGLLLTTLVGRGQQASFAPGVLAYEYGSGWWEYAFYLGPLALTAVAVGLAGARRAWPLGALGVFFLWIGLDWTQTLGGLQLWPWLEHAPVWSSQRCPSRFLAVAVLAFTTVSALGLERLWRWAHARRARAAWLVALALSLAVSADLFLESRAWQRAALGPPLRSRSHEPQPRVLRPGAGVEIALREFAPNRLVYRARAERPASVAFPLAQPDGAGGWRVDGLPAESLGGRLVVGVTPGERDIVMTYRPPYLRAGAALSAATLAALGLWARSAARRRSRLRPADSF